jgi:hypothetical protein
MLRAVTKMAPLTAVIFDRDTDEDEGKYIIFFFFF